MLQKLKKVRKTVLYDFDPMTTAHGNAANIGWDIERHSLLQNTLWQALLPTFRTTVTAIILVLMQARAHVTLYKVSK
jgi:hypothetical protein